MLLYIFESLCIIRRNGFSKMQFEFLITVDSRNKVQSNPPVFPEYKRSSSLKLYLHQDNYIDVIYSADKG